MSRPRVISPLTAICSIRAQKPSPGTRSSCPSPTSRRRFPAGHREILVDDPWSSISLLLSVRSIPGGPEGRARPAAFLGSPMVRTSTARPSWFIRPTRAGSPRRNRWWQASSSALSACPLHQPRFDARGGKGSAAHAGHARHHRPGPTRRARTAPDRPAISRPCPAALQDQGQLVQGRDGRPASAAR